MLSSLSASATPEVREALADGRFSAALRSALAADDLAAAGDVLRIGWFDLMRGDHDRAARSALEALPVSALTAHPLLAMALGFMFSADRLRRSKAAFYFGLASLGIRSPGERTSPVERALVLASESASLRLLGKTALAAKSARAGVLALEAVTPERTSLIGYLPRVYCQLGSSLYYGGAETEALRVFARGYAESGESDPSSFGNISMLAGVHALRGSVTEAAEYAALCRRDAWSDVQRSQYTGTFYRLAEAVIALERFDTAEARRHLDAMDHDRRSIEHWVAIAIVEALAGLLDDDAAGALAGLEAFVVERSADGHTAANRRRLASMRALLHLALGNHEATATVLQRDGDRAPQSHVDRARLALATGRTSDALRELRAIAGRSQPARTLAQALVLEAAIAVRHGPSARTDGLLRQLASVLRRTGQGIALHLVPRDDFAALCDALDAAGMQDLTRHRARGSLLAAPEHPALTPREAAVLRALVRSGSHGAIAAELFVSANTVKSQLRSLYRKLGARNREEALTIAMHRRLIVPNPEVAKDAVS